MKNFPDHILEQIIGKVDSFENEIEKFQVVINNESEIIPELTIQLHEILDLLGRFQIMSEKFKNKEFNLESDMNRLVLKRAHLFSVKELLDEYFSELINDLSEKADVSDKFKEIMFEFNSEKTRKSLLEIQNLLIERMLESLSRQLGRKITFNDL